jgi:MerR family transcriptional regulator, redox-sensitive transcriptional activator SoxR
MGATSELSIGEASGRTGVAASTLRYWEREGLLQAPQRVGGKRRYGPQVLRQIEMVTLSKRAGFSLAETRVILAGFSEKTAPPAIWRRLADSKLPEIERTLAEAKAMKAILEEGLRCECLDLAECLAGNPARSGQA